MLNYINVLIKKIFAKEVLEMTPEFIEISKKKIWTSYVEYRGEPEYIASQEELDILMKIRKLTDEEWLHIGSSFILSESFMEKNCKKLNWSTLCIHLSEYMSEEFLVKMKKYIKWNSVCYRKKLSIPFIIQNNKDVDWMNLILNENYSTEEMQKIAELGKTYCPYYGHYTQHLKY